MLFVFAECWDIESSGCMMYSCACSKRAWLCGRLCNCVLFGCMVGSLIVWEMACISWCMVRVCCCLSLWLCV